MTRIIISSHSGPPLEVEKAAFDAGFFPDYAYVRDAAGAAAPYVPGYLEDDIDALLATPTSKPAVRLKAALVPKWQPSTAYALGDFVLNPSGQVVSAKAAFTSGASYSASDWTIIGSTSLPTQTGNAGKFLTTDGTAASWGTPAGGGSVTDATTGAKGIVQLAGDLGGTAASPQVTGGTHHGHTASQISDATAIGRTLLTATDAAAERTALGLGTAATQPSSAFDAAGAAAAAQTAAQTYAAGAAAGLALVFGA